MARKLITADSDNEHFSHAPLMQIMTLLRIPAATLFHNSTPFPLVIKKDGWSTATGEFHWVE